MNLDIEDIFAGVFGSIIARGILFLLAVWLGCTIGAAALMAGVFISEGSLQVGRLGFYLIASPLLLFSVWAFLNIPFLLFSFIYFIRSEGPIYRAWGIVVGVQSLAVMAGWASTFVVGWLPLVASWIIWAVLLGMLETGVWLIYQSRVNAWARDLGMLRAASAQRRAEKEAEEHARIVLEKEADR